MIKRRFVLIAILLVGCLVYLEAPFSRPAGWWKITDYYPFVSGPVRWRLIAPLLKMRGRFPEIGWGELWGYVRDLRSDPTVSGFVTLDGDDAEECSARWATPLGEIWGRPTDGDLLEFLVIEQLIERAYDDALVGVRSGDIVIDVGGHLGTFTRFALVRGAARVIVVEPDPFIAECLRKTFRDEIGKNVVHVAEVAAWDENTSLNFQVARLDNTGNGMIWGEGQEYGNVLVRAVTIDHLIEELELERVDFLKLDIEGAERRALAGAHQTMARFGPRMAVCTYHADGDYEAVTQTALAARPEYRLRDGRGHVYLW